MDGNAVSLISLEGTQQVLSLRGLPTAQFLVGAKFLFGDEEHFVAGSIKSVGYGPEGMSLYVTPPRYRGKFIQRLKEKGAGWVAVSPEGEETPGTFCLI